MSLTVKKFQLDSFYLIFSMDDHLVHKNELLTLIENQEPETYSALDSYYTDNISKLDWQSSDDFTRPWTENFKPKLNALLDGAAFGCGYDHCEILNLWFQQYHINDTHGWHIHSGNFTGIYYLEFPKHAPKTELLIPYKQEKIIVPDVNEGDILIFPSYVIHRAPKMKEELRKTIISFNCNFSNIDRIMLSNINVLSEEKK